MSDEVQKVDVQISGESEVDPLPWSKCGPIVLDSQDIPNAEEAEDSQEANGVDPEEAAEARRMLREERSRNRKKYIRFASTIVNLAEKGHSQETVAGMLGVPVGAIRNGFAREFLMGKSRGLDNWLTNLSEIAADKTHKGCVQATVALAKHFGMKDSQDINHHISSDSDARKDAQQIMMDPILYRKARNILDELERSQPDAPTGN